MEFSLANLQPKERASFALRALYEAAGCRKYHMGRFEEYGLYQANRSFLSSEQVITFTDLDGRLLALKPDVTLSIAKTAQPAPGETLRYYYHENVYRPSAESHTFKEISQMGLEMLGAVGEAQVQQAVCLAARSLDALGAEWVLEVSHMGYLFGLFDALGVPEAARPGLLETLRAKNIHELRAAAKAAGLSDADANALTALLSLSGEYAVALPKAAALCRNARMEAAVAELEALAQPLAKAGGSIRLTGAPWYNLWVSSAQNVTVDANALPRHASFACSGIVDITQRDGSAIVEWDSDAAWYLLEYYPETEQPYVVTLNGETGEVRSDSYQLNNLDDLRAVQHLLITPASLLPDDVDSDAVGQFITDASGVLVSAALAGAAIYGGYEVATRVMLKNLLPEGAAIPATRGELAQLLWNAAGRPEAGAVVTVYPDITDADQQAAARWCTEQGLLTARSDGTFAPDGRVPKWRVIEVWNHAFAK